MPWNDNTIHCDGIVEDKSLWNLGSFCFVGKYTLIIARQREEWQLEFTYNETNVSLKPTQLAKLIQVGYLSIDNFRIMSSKKNML